MLELAFVPIWNRLPYLTLDLFPDRVEWNDLVVLVEEEGEAGLTRMLSRSGIHAVTLLPGVEKQEVRRFLEVLDQKRRLDADGDQDLVTMLFREDLHHIRYTVGGGAVTDVRAARGVRSRRGIDGVADACATLARGGRTAAARRDPWRGPGRGTQHPGCGA